ncbi:MAG: ankyrin repeat domain-containing protein [Maribacter sp.]|nr:ankyrin repeat domain-containing protein [Maribacter sp.]
MLKQFHIDIVYISIIKSYSSIKTGPSSVVKSFIMKKTMLIVAAAMMLTVSVVSAKVLPVRHNVAELTALYEKGTVNSFCKAIIQGDIAIIKKMIALGEDVNQKSLGMTPAIFAARYNKAEILKLLIDNGADIRIRSDSGYSIAKYAEAANAKDALIVINAKLGS